MVVHQSNQPHRRNRLRIKKELLPMDEIQKPETPKKSRRVLQFLQPTQLQQKQKSQPERARLKMLLQLRQSQKLLPLKTEETVTEPVLPNQLQLNQHLAPIHLSVTVKLIASVQSVMTERVRTVTVTVTATAAMIVSAIVIAVVDQTTTVKKLNQRSLRMMY